MKVAEQLKCSERLNSREESTAEVQSSQSVRSYYLRSSQTAMAEETKRKWLLANTR